MHLKLGPRFWVQIKVNRNIHLNLPYSHVHFPWAQQIVVFENFYPKMQESVTISACSYINQKLTLICHAQKYIYLLTDEKNFKSLTCLWRRSEKKFLKSSQDYFGIHIRVQRKYVILVFNV